MTKLLDKAIAEIKKLPPERQEEVAAAMMFMIDADAAPRLTPAQEAEVRASMDARDFLTDDEVRSLYERYGV